MSKSNLSRTKIPNYTKGEEIFNMVSHIVGGGLGIIMLVVLIIVTALNNDVWGIIGCSIYGLATIIMFTVSSVYHGLHINNGKRVMRIIDHCDIYFMIAGTYTPILLCAIRPVYPAIAWTVFALEWGLTALAVVLNAINLEKFKALSMICYIGMGWGIIFVLPQTIKALTFNGFLLVLLGGISYTIGAIIYGLGKKIKYMHSVFHIFVVFGCVLQFFSILFYVV